MYFLGNNIINIYSGALLSRKKELTGLIKIEGLAGWGKAKKGIKDAG